MPITYPNRPRGLVNPSIQTIFDAGFIIFFFRIIHYMNLRALCCTLLVILLGSIQLKAQITDMTQGELAMKERNFEKAIALFKKAAAANPTDVQITEKLAAAYMALGDYETAETIYQKLAANPHANKEDKFYYAQALRNNDKYDLAEKEYQEFAAAAPYDPRAVEFKHFGDQIPDLLFDRGAYDIINIPENSDASDVGPVFCLADICFSSNRASPGTEKHRDLMSGKEFYDLYLLPGGGGAKAGLPEKVKGEVNSKLNEGPCTFSKDGMEMIFTRTNKVKAADGTYKLGLYHSDYDSVKRKWVNIKPVDFINYNYNMAHPSLSKDGKQLFFVSDMPGGFGETDIYVSLKTGKAWGDPINLGKEINTQGNDMFPFISDKGILFFASDCRVGLGGLDIYSATNIDGQWSDVHNLGAPFNSNYDDFGYICDESQLTGYFVSNRPGGKGSDDIYKFIRKTQRICGQVIDAESKLPIANTAIEFISVGGDNANITSDKNGMFCVALEAGLGYFVKAEVADYNKYEAMMSVSHTVNPSLIFAMEPKGGVMLNVEVEKDNCAVPNASIKLENINMGETETQKSSPSGTVVFKVSPRQFYSLTVAARPDGPEPYKETSRTLSTAGKKPGDTLSVTIQCQGYSLIASGTLLPNLFFGANSAEIPAEAQRNLDNIVRQMNANPKWELEITGFSDWKDSEQNSPDLALRRAKNCVEYLAAHGVDKNRLEAIGYGDKSAAGGQSYPSGQNRRVQFRILNQE